MSRGQYFIRGAPNTPLKIAESHPRSDEILFRRLRIQLIFFKWFFDSEKYWNQIRAYGRHERRFDLGKFSRMKISGLRQNVISNRSPVARLKTALDGPVGRKYRSGVDPERL